MGLCAEPIIYRRLGPQTRVLVGSSFIDTTPKVGIPPGSVGGPELGDLLVVTAYTRDKVINRGRAILFQAKGPTTALPSHQENLYRDWPPFGIWSPKINGARWDVGPEGVAVPPSRRGAALLRVERNKTPQRSEIDGGRPATRWASASARCSACATRGPLRGSIRTWVERVSTWISWSHSSFSGRATAHFSNCSVALADPRDRGPRDPDQLTRSSADSGLLTWSSRTRTPANRASGVASRVAATLPLSATNRSITQHGK